MSFTARKPYDAYLSFLRIAHKGDETFALLKILLGADRDKNPGRVIFCKPGQDTVFDGNINRFRNAASFFGAGEDRDYSICLQQDDSFGNAPLAAFIIIKSENNDGLTQNLAEVAKVVLKRHEASEITIADINRVEKQLRNRLHIEYGDFAADLKLQVANYAPCKGMPAVG